MDISSSCAPSVFQEDNMSASYHGYFDYQCYNECLQTGCPGHHGRLVSKHGGYYVETLGPDNVVLHRIDLGDIGMMDAVFALYKRNP